MVADCIVQKPPTRCLGRLAVTATTRKSRFDSLHQEVYLSLWRTYDRLKSIEDELFAGVELSAQQYNSLRLLEAVHPKTLPTTVPGNKLISRSPDMTRLLDRLEDRGLVHRSRRTDNRRVVEVGITDAGMLLLKQLAEPVRDCHSKQIGHLTEPQLSQLLELLNSARFPHEVEGSLWRHET